ncbi:hypothetical protein ABPG74_015303 [Tetrahymena malaccensis]
MSTTNKLISILKKEDKSSDDILFLKVYLSKNKFFQQVFESFKASPEINNEICRAVKYETYPKFSIIFKQGDTNCDKAYIILKGRIMIFMKNTIDVFQKEGDSNENQQIELTTKKWIVEQLLESQLEKNDEAARNEVPEQDFLAVLGQSYGKLLIEVEEGALFGEKALIENKPRAATICSKTPCEFLILNKEDFEIVQIKYNKAQQDKKDFIMNKFPFLGNLITSGRVFERVVRFFDEETYHKNQIIVKEGVQIAPANQKLFVIVQGEIQLYKNIIKKINNPHSLIEKQIEQIHIATLGQSEVFGEELLEIQQDEKSYLYTAVCVSPNSQFLTININVLDKKMPDQMKDFIQANYFSKKNLRESILLSHDKQKKEIELMRKKNMKDQFEFEKNLLVKIRKIQVEKDQENELDKKQEQINKNIQSIQESPIKKNQIYYKINKKNSFEEKLADCSSFNQIHSKQFVSNNYLEEQQHQIQYRDEEEQEEAIQNQIRQHKFNEQMLQKTQKYSIRTQKSVDSDELLDKQNEKLQAIQGDSNQQNMVLFHQLRSDVNEKIKKEGGYKKDINFGFYYEREMQYNEDKQQMEIKKCNPYPFKLIANNKHLKQLETRLKQKKFQFADAQGILSKTKYYQAKEKNELSLKQMIEEGLTKSKYYHDEDQKQKKNNQENSSLNKQSFSQMLKRSFEKEKDQSQDQKQFMQKKVGISNLFNDHIKASEYGSKIENTGRNLFACSHKIKLHSVLKRISDNYQLHPEYYEDNENLAQIIELSKNNSEQQYKFYQISQAKKSSVETRKILNRSPVIRKLKIVQYSSQHGGGVSIPSNKRHIIENSLNQLNKVRPSSDEARYNKNNSPLKQVDRYFYQKDSFVMQSSAQSLTKNEANKSLSPQYQNKDNFKANKLSVKYMQFQQKLPNNGLATQDMFQVEGNYSQGVQRLHSSQKHRGPKNTITNQKFKENSKCSEFSFVNNNQPADLNISKENSVQKKIILMKSSSFVNNKEHNSPQKQAEFKVQNNDDISFSQQYQQQSVQIEQSLVHEQNNSLVKQNEQIQKNASNHNINNNESNILKQSIENISDSKILLQKNLSQNSLKKNEPNDQLGENKSKKNIYDNNQIQKQLSSSQTKEQISGNQDKEQILQPKSKDQLGDSQKIEQIDNLLDKKQLSASLTYESVDNNQKQFDENNLLALKNSKILSKYQSQSLVGSKVELSHQIDQLEQSQKENSQKLSSKKNSQKKLTLSTEVQAIQQEQKEQENINFIGDLSINQKLNVQISNNHDIKENSSSVEHTQESSKSVESTPIQNKQSQQNQQVQKQSKKSSTNNQKKQTKKKTSKQDKSNNDEPKKQSQKELKTDEKQ